MFLLSNESTYASLSTFESIEELNAATRSHRNSHDLSATDTAVLDVLAQHSCVYKGVSYLSKANIAKQVGVVRRTVIRACKRLEALGIIVQYGVKRVSGDRRQTSNAIVIQPASYTQVTTRESDRVTPAKSHQEARLSLKLSASNTYKDTYTTGASADMPTHTPTHTPTSEHTNANVLTGANALRNSIPAAIYDALAPFYDYDGLYEAYGVLLRAKASIDRNITVEEHADTFTGIFVNAVRKMKRGAVRNLNGYLYAAWREACRVIDRKRTFSTVAAGVLSYDWR